ncbi:MAG: hypothetical protein ACO3F7_05940 [Luteolibacter sp.]
MHDDTSHLEAELRKLRPSGPHDQLIDRLERCALGDWSEPLDAELDFEEKLRAESPARLDPALMASLEAICTAIPFPKEKNIVGFPKTKALPPASKRGQYAAAAAIALLGAATALLYPIKESNPSSMAKNAPADEFARTNGPTLTPASFKRGLTAASDEGVVWQAKQGPHRVLKFTYQDCATLRDDKGRTYEVEQPRVEYLFVPAKTD